MICNIKKQNILDYLIIFLMYSQLIIFGFLGLERKTNKLIVVLIIICFFCNIEKLMRLKLALGFLALLIVLFSLNAINSLSINNSVLKSNFLMQFYPMLYVLYIYYLCNIKSDFIDKIIKNAGVIINFTFIINLIVLIMQINFPYLVTAVVTENVIDYYEDTISGLFAYGSTHVVCIFSTFIIIYNLAKINFLKLGKKYNFLYIIYILLIMILSFYIAINSDNKAFFIILPLFLIIYFLNTFSIKKYINRQYLLIIITIILIMLLIIIIKYNFTIKFIQNNIIKLFEIIIKSHKMGNKAHGSGERIAILSYAFSVPNTWLLGDGFGGISMYQEGYRKFVHFGQADLGSILILGGIWYTLVVLLYYVFMFTSMITNTTKIKSKKTALLILGSILCVSIYCQCFTRINIMSALILIMLTLRYKYSIINAT